MSGRLAGREVVIVEAVRTAVGRGHPEKGVFRELHPETLLGTALAEVIARAGIPAAAVEDVVGGCVQQVGEQSTNVTRNAWLGAGLAVETPATTVDRQCGSGQQAINFAAALIGIGAHDVAIGCGVEHMGRLPLSLGPQLAAAYGTPYPPALMERFALVAPGESAELIARALGRHPRGVRRDRAALPAPRGAGGRDRALRARDRAGADTRRPDRGRPGHPPRDHARGARRS